MNSEQQELVDLAYKNYIYNPDYKAEGVADLMSSQAGQLVKCPTQEHFITECKTDSKFSEKWGLKIEERELNVDELNIVNLLKQTSTKLITITYNNKTIESYD
jgi:hypothetical protein